MHIKLITIGITSEGYLSAGLADYEKRLSRYTGFERIDLPAVKNGGKMSHEELKEKEEVLLKKELEESDVIVLLDEKGKELDSVEFSGFIQKVMNTGKKRMVFIVGGAFGFSEGMKKLATYKVSLSRMTLTHQMVRLFFTEQLYRAFTIIKGEKYHHS